MISGTYAGTSDTRCAGTSDTGYAGTGDRSTASTGLPFAPENGFANDAVIGSRDIDEQDGSRAVLHAGIS